MVTEKYQKINQLDDIVNASGSAYGRDREEVKFAAALERRFTSQLHADINASYYWLDYTSDENAYGSLYGWDRWQIGTEFGFAASKWTDILIAMSYQGYQQENTENVKGNSLRVSDRSNGWTVQGGIGSYATDRITYRLLAGWSMFEYGGSGGDTANGFTYTANSQWKISDTWSTMIQATSYYQPSEREYSTSTRVDSFSWGIAHVMVRGKLHSNFDIAYRRETHEYSFNKDHSNDYDLDIFSARLGFNYILNRYITLFCNFEYRNSIPSGGAEGKRGDYYDYDKFRGIFGLRFTYSRAAADFKIRTGGASRGISGRAAVPSAYERFLPGGALRGLGVNGAFAHQFGAIT